MSLHHADTRHGIPRPRARAPTALVSGAAALFALAPTVAAGSPARDTDCDGVVDASDDCRAVAEDRDGHDDGDGCPDADNDGDRIGDEVDQCPDEAEVVNDFEDEDGCPDRAVEVRKDRIGLEQRIHFATRRAASGTSDNVRAHNRRVEFLIEFALVLPSQAAVRETARARASFRSAVNRFHAQPGSGCMPVSPAASERVSRTAWSLNARDDVLEAPLGVGFNYRLDPLILDGRGVYRRMFYDDLIQAAIARARPELDTRNATLIGGFEF